MREPTRSIVRAAAALGIVGVVMWQMSGNRDAAVVTAKPNVAAPKPAGSSLAEVSPPAPAASQAGVAEEKSSVVEEAERALALAKAKEDEAAAEAAKAAKALQPAEAAKTAKAAEPAKVERASPRKPAATTAVTEPPSVDLSNRTRLVVQTEAAPPPPSGGPGVRPTPKTVQAADNSQDHPSFPGCRWATPTRWVCDGVKQ